MEREKYKRVVSLLRSVNRSVIVCVCGMRDILVVGLSECRGDGSLHMEQRLEMGFGY